MQRPREVRLSIRTIQALSRFHPLGAVTTDYVFPLCSRRTIQRHIRAAAQAAGLGGNFGAESPRLGMRQDLTSALGVPYFLHTCDSLAIALLPQPHPPGHHRRCLAQAPRPACSAC